MRRSIAVLAAAFVLAFAGAALLYRFAGRGTSSAEETTAARSSSASTAPAFSLTDVDGNVVHSSSLRGKPLVINFFATWCPPCREEIPGFVEVYNKYKDRGFELVGISLDDDTGEHLAAFVARHQIDYRILRGDSATARAYGGVTALPTTFFIARNGTIREVHIGAVDRDTFDREVQKLL